MNYTFQSVFSNSINGFIEFREAQGFTTETTVKYLRKFDHYCMETTVKSANLTKVLVDDWLQYEQNNGFIDMAGRSQALRVFAKYLKGLGNDSYVIPTFLYRTKRTFVPYILSSKELVDFFDATDRLQPWHCGDAFVAEVAPVIFRLIYTSGLRPQEACSLENSDVNLKTGEILIRVNKRKKQRIIVVSDDMLQLLNEYIERRTQIFVRTPYFFPRIDGTKYTSQQLGTVCDRCWEMANPMVDIEHLPKLRPYDFRHSFASAALQRWINEGVDLFTMLPYLRTYMGHEHFSDTAYYIHILPERLISSPGVNWDMIDSSVPEVSIWD